MDTRERGECPGCGGSGAVGDPCPGAACRRAGLHFIPAVFARSDDPDRPRHPLLGQWVEDWLLVDRLGGRGAGGLFRALDLEGDRTAALRLLNLDDDDRRERRLAALGAGAGRLRALNHPNVARLLDHGVWSGMAYLATEFVEGASLAQWIHDRHRVRSGFRADEVRELIGQALDGLEAAHAGRILHRDVTPDHLVIQIGRGGAVRVRLVGFACHDDATSTVAPIADGTPEYLAPEQFRPHAVGPSSDLYALATIVHEMVTGALPFGGDRGPGAFLRKIDRAEDPADALDGAGWPEPLVAFLRSALSPDPAARPADAAAFRTAFLQALDALAAQERAEEAAELGRDRIVVLGLRRPPPEPVAQAAADAEAPREESPAPVLRLHPSAHAESPAQERDRHRREALRAWIDRKLTTRTPS